MWQSSGLKTNFYTIKTANTALLAVLGVYALIDIFELAVLVLFGQMVDITASIWLRALVDVPILLIAFMVARPKEALRFRAPKIKNVVYTLLLAFFVYLTLSVLLNFIAEAILQAGGGIPGNAIAAEVSGYPFVVAFLFFCVLAPVAEEILFRGMIQNAYERKIGFWAVVVSGVLFGLMHADPLAILNGAAVGIVLGYLYLKTRSIWCAILFHAVYNFLAFTYLSEVLVINLPWVLGLFPPETMTFTNFNYIAYNIGIALIGILMSGVLLWFIQRENPENRARKSSAYAAEGGQTAVLVVALVLLGLRVAVGISGYLV